MTKRIETVIYLLLIFLLPTQFGKHFWPLFSFIGGLRIDYLSPTLYVTDILMIILALTSLYRLFVSKITNYELGIRNYGKKKKKNNFKFQISNFKFPIGIGIFTCVLLIGILLAKNQGAAVYGLVKVLEMVFFGWYTVRVVGKTVSFKQIAFVLGASVFCESLLAIIQFFSQGSVGGIFYFFGERTFSSITPGIANASIAGQLLLRPYGTLPHPNVLAGFLLIAMIFVVFQWQAYRKIEKVLIAISLLVGSTALFLTLSRITILLFVILVSVGVFLLLKRKRKIGVIEGLGGLGILGIIGFLGSVVLGRFMSSSFLEESFLVRVDLLQNAGWMIMTHPLLGVGLMNFLGNLPAYQQTQNFYLHLQPVHNIFFLIFAEVGILGGLGVLGGLGLTVIHVWSAQKTPLRLACFLMLGSIFILGMFDHYFVTLQTGQLLFSFVIGLCFSLPTQIVEKKQLSRQKRNFK